MKKNLFGKKDTYKDNAPLDENYYDEQVEYESLDIEKPSSPIAELEDEPAGEYDPVEEFEPAGEYDPVEEFNPVEEYASVEEAYIPEEGYAADLEPAEEYYEEGEYDPSMYDEAGNYIGPVEEYDPSWYDEDGNYIGPVEEYSEEQYDQEEYSEEYDEDAYQEEIAYQEDYYVGGAVPVDANAAYEEEQLYEDDEEEEEEDRGILGFFFNSSLMDKIIALVSVGVLVMAIVLCFLFVNANNIKEQNSAFGTIGKQLERITMIGEKGILAVSSAEVARIKQEQALEDEEDDSYIENPYATTVAVQMTMTSVQKDLKIRFTNRETGKLIGHIPFEVEVTEPNGTTIEWADDDMDGVIYKKDIESGTYSLKLKSLAGDRYESYILPASTMSAEVKRKIEYTKVDVTGEAKTESEVDAKKEDTKKNETVVESKLQDTVEWVASTATTNTYIEVIKTTIPDPLTLYKAGKLAPVAYVATISSSALELTLGDETKSSATLTASCVDDAGVAASFKSIQWKSSNESVVKVEPVSGNESQAKVTALGETTEAVAISYTAVIETTLTGSDLTGDTVSGTCMVTVKPASLEQIQLSIDKDKATLRVKKVTEEKDKDSTTVQATISNKAAGKEYEFKVASDNTKVATAAIDANGLITIVAQGAGSAKVEVSASYKTTDAAAAAASLVKKTIEVKVVESVTIVPTKDNKTVEDMIVYLANPDVLQVKVENALSDTTPIKAAVEDATVATVEVKADAPRQVTITGLKEGVTNLVISFANDSTETPVEVKLPLVIQTHPKIDRVRKLLDENEQPIYVLENNVYRQAVYADYYTYSQFYIMTGVKYTGWQTIDGKLYYFNSKGIKVTGEQVIQGAKYNFASDGSLASGSGIMGIDVSKWNGTIDWKAVKNSGISYAIIRVGYRGSSQGMIIEDPKFAANMKGATDAGIKVGVYFFTQAVDEIEAVYEASYVIDKISKYKISYPVFLDVEASGGRGDMIHTETRTKVCKAFCQTIQNAGYTAGIYANKTWLNEKINTNELTGYKIWLAQYASTPTYAGRYDMWQYTSKGKVSGISGDVDLNISYLGY